MSENRTNLEELIALRKNLQTVLDQADRLIQKFRPRHTEAKILDLIPAEGISINELNKISNTFRTLTPSVKRAILQSLEGDGYLRIESVILSEGSRRTAQTLYRI